jgi:hypothetical protein
MPVHQTQAEIWLTVGTTLTLTPLIIQWKETNEESRTLGCYIAPNANTKCEQEILMNKSLHFGAAARRRGTTKTEACYKYMVYTNTAMEFPLGVSRLSHKHLTDIQCFSAPPNNKWASEEQSLQHSCMHHKPTSALDSPRYPSPANSCIYACFTATSEKTRTRQACS